MNTTSKFFRISYPIVAIMCIAFLASACGAPPEEKKPNPPKTNKPVAPKLKPVTPLSQTAFVYVRKRSKSQNDIYTYDTKTKKQKLVVKVDGPDTSRWSEVNISLSPDRQWIAFTGHFRQSETERATKYPIEALWLVSVDGKQFRRLSKPIPAPTKPRHGYTRSLRNPQWSNDGKSIWLLMGQFWQDSSYKTQGGVSIAKIPSTGGQIETMPKAVLCQVTESLRTSRSQNRFAVTHSNCSSGRSGIYTYDNIAKKFHHYSIHESYRKLKVAQWSNTSAHMYFISKTTWEDSNTGKIIEATGVFKMDLKSGKTDSILHPLVNGKEYTQFILLADNKTMVMELIDPKTKTKDLFHTTYKDRFKVYHPITQHGQSFAIAN